MVLALRPARLGGLGTHPLQLRLLRQARHQRVLRQSTSKGMKAEGGDMALQHLCGLQNGPGDHHLWGL